MFAFYFIQGYEARLFRLNKAHGGMVTSAEEAVDLQKKISALNRFYRTWSQSNKNSVPSGVGTEENIRKRDVGEKLVVSCFISSSFVHCHILCIVKGFLHLSLLIFFISLCLFLFYFWVGWRHESLLLVLFVLRDLIFVILKRAYVLFFVSISCILSF